MAERYADTRESYLQAKRDCPMHRQINILLLGPTGVGKTTFINAFANYIVYNTLKDAEAGEIQTIIPSSFSFTSPDTFDEVPITLGLDDKHERFSDTGASNTQLCRSFMFPIGDRNLRLIDTPGIGDTRGPEQDSKNFQEILNYIAQYEHLNGICILLKPNEERLTVLFRFCVNELLRHLHMDARENLIFVFTNARATFFSPGSTKKLLEGMLTKHHDNFKVIVPFTRANTFLVDNEPFRYLAIRKSGIHLDDDQTESYIKSWEHSVKEYTRLMEYLVTRPLHAVKDTVSLNEAEQLVRKLPRPIAETAKLIEENIQLANDYKKKVLENPLLTLPGIPQVDVKIVPLQYPRTVCVGDNCCRVIEDGDDMKIEYLSICHDECYLIGVEQETLYDPKLQDCSAMDAVDGFCTTCDCHWLQHKHITYEYKTNRTHINGRNTGKNKELSLADIDKRIGDLREEAAKIQEVYRKLAEFLYANSILPVNDGIIDYLQYFIREEQMKKNAGAQNDEVITRLNQMMTQFAEDMELLKRTLEEQKESGAGKNIIQPEEIFELVGGLYQLPITGKQIQRQVEGIKVGEFRIAAEREIYVKLPGKAASSQVMVQMKKVASDR